MKWVALLALLFASSAHAQTDPLPAPEKWRRESFHFPLNFAPSIGFEGTEHVRFAPGWGEFASDRGFSYVFMWDVKEVAGPALTVHGLEFTLRDYFDGLMEAATETRKLDRGDSRTLVNFHPMREVPHWSEAHAGDIYTWNAFSRGEPIRLNVEVTKRSCPGGKAQILFAVSKAARDAPIWNELRAVRERAVCAG